MSILFSNFIIPVIIVNIVNVSISWVDLPLPWAPRMMAYEDILSLFLIFSLRF